MRAARWHGAGDVRIEDVDEPELSRRGDVLIDVDLATICASDLAEWRDGPHVIPVGRPHRLTGVVAPVTLGHEYVGRVREVGEGVTGLSVGDRVCGDACLRCGRCYWCVRGEYNICEVGGSVGLHHDGAFAARLVVPDYTLAAVPTTVDDRSAAVVEPLAVSLHALRQVRMQAGDSVLVVGMGMIGAGVLMLAVALGARTVIVLEPSPSRQALAGKLGAAAVLDPRVADTRREVRQLTGIGADVVLDCTGRPDTLGDAIEFSRRGGRIAICGISHEPSIVHTDRLVYFERELVGCLGYRYDHATVLGLLANGHLDTSHLFADPIELTDLVDSGLRRMAEDPGVELRVPVLTA
jgi:(R,R)-butanediol dehydrogenase/meso-butanediol dehydrogenase/diacetyl reductase